MPKHQLNAEQSAERKARIVELRRQRKHWDAIGAEFDISGARAYQLYRQALDARPNLQVDEHRAEEGELVDMAVRRLMAIAVNPQVSHRTQVEAWSAVRGWAEHKARLWGLYAPTRSRVEVVEPESVDEAIRELEAKLASNDELRSPVEP